MASSDFDSRFLDDLVGTKVTTFYDIDPPATSSNLASVASMSADFSLGISYAAVSPPASHTTTSYTIPHPTTASTATTSLCAPDSRFPEICCTWVLTEKLSEQAYHHTREQVEKGIGPPMIIGIFLCHLEEDPAQLALMRVYYQIPITGTECSRPDIRAQQVGPPKICGEREAFKLLMRQGCSAVPRFLGYGETTQEREDPVPGGFVRYLAWEKVPGESLTEEFFWSLDRSKRDDIRAKFRLAFEEILHCRVIPQIPAISKIIYDQSTGNICISGFRMGWPIRDKFQWSETRYLAYGLVKLPKGDRKWRLNSDNWEK